MTPLLTVAGTLSGVYLGSRLNQRQRGEEDERKRRTLATLLLQELRLLEIVLKDIHHSSELEWEGVEPFHTAVYDQAGSELLRLMPDTIDQLAYSYQLVHTLQMELNRFRHRPPGSRAWHDAVLKVRATQAALRIHDVARFLVTEGGIWPRPFPTMMMRTFPPEGPPFPAPTFAPPTSEGSTGSSEWIKIATVDQTPQGGARPWRGWGSPGHQDHHDTDGHDLLDTGGELPQLAQRHRDASTRTNTSLTLVGHVKPTRGAASTAR